MIDDALPRQLARTSRFTAGIPRHMTVTPDGGRVLFLRSAAGDDAVQRLWVLDVDHGTERVVADPAALVGDTSEDEVPAEERALRERNRELGAGITAYATDDAVRLITFAYSGRLWLADPDGAVRELPTVGAAVGPRLDPTGRRVGYVASGALRIIDAEGNDDRVLAEPEAEEVSYGLAEFVAAEEMDRDRGFTASARIVA